MQSKVVKPQKLPCQSNSRCGALTRKGSPCQSSSMENGRCRMHGGASTGAPKGNVNALKHGHYSAAAIAERGAMRGLIKKCGSAI